MTPRIRAIEFPETIQAVRRYERDGVAATNKPVTLRWALGRIERDKPRLTSFAEAETELRPLLDELARPGTLASHAFWRLKHDMGAYWEVVYDGPGGGRSKEPPLTDLREHGAAGFSAGIHAALANDPDLRRRTAAILDRLIEAGRPPGAVVRPTPPERRSVERLVRHTGFRADVMAAYRGSCAVCGYAGRVAGRAVGLEAAHVRPLGKGGPETVDNGMVLCSLHHDLFDAGAFAFDEDRRLVVSTANGGDAGDATPLELYAGRLLPEPANGAWRVAAAHLAWHRRNVFLTPA